MFRSSERNAEHLGVNGEELAQVPFIWWHKRLRGLWVLMDELAHRSSKPLMPQVEGGGHGSGIVFLSLSKQKVTLYMVPLYDGNEIRYGSAGDEHEYVPSLSICLPLPTSENDSVCTILSGNLTNLVSSSESLNDPITVVNSWKGRLSVKNYANFSQYITQIYHLTLKLLYFRLFLWRFCIIFRNWKAPVPIWHTWKRLTGTVSTQNKQIWCRMEIFYS